MEATVRYQYSHISTTTFLSSLAVFLVGSFYILYWFPAFALGTFTLVPLLLSKRWWTHPAAPRSFFVRLKLYSVLIASIFFSYMLTRNLSPRWFHLTAAALLLFNITEALIVDWRKGEAYTWINGSLGLILNALLMTQFWNGPGVTSPVLGELSLSWIVAYSLWNWTFVYLHWPNLASKHMIVLGSSLFIALLSQGTWLLSRAYILTLFLMIQFTVPINFSHNFLDQIPSWNRDRTARWALIAAFASTLWACVDFIFSRF